VLITEEYRKLNEQLHNSNDGYGRSGHKWADAVRQILAQTKGTSVLDYGCGKKTLQEALGFEIANYDPAVPGLDAPPDPADVVACTDVLEHIEPECLDEVLRDLNRCTKEVILLVVATRPAKKTLADGRNAHLIQRPINWWLEQIGKGGFEPLQVSNMGGEFLYVGRVLR
jgi:hypothetical protein